MGQSTKNARSFFSHPISQLILMVGVVVCVAVGAWLAYGKIAPVFWANPWLNGFIILVFAIGIMTCFWQAFQLIASVGWLGRYTGPNAEVSAGHAPRLLVTLAALLSAREARDMRISTTSARSILDSVATRIEEARDITRYIVNLLIFLGLLGTFYGLATTVPALVDTIRSLSPAEGEGGTDVFARLMAGLEQQLGGMGTAFASSLLGLAGSLVVGLLELFASHGQNRFYRELEDWLSTITRLGFSSGEGDESGVGIVLDHMTEQMESLQRLFSQSDAARAQTDARITGLTAAIERMIDHNDSGSQTQLEQIAKTQDKIAEHLVQSPNGEDAEARMRLRSIDVQLLKLLEEVSTGRQETNLQLRQDMRSLARVIADAAGYDPDAQEKKD
ncbi:MAG: biopolymer transporter ExbB [Halocynthiibacter sp.]